MTLLDRIKMGPLRSWNGVGREPCYIGGLKNDWALCVEGACTAQICLLGH